MERTLKEIKIGSHVGMAGKEMFLASVKEAVSYGATYIPVHRKTQDEKMFLN